MSEPRRAIRTTPDREQQRKRQQALLHMQAGDGNRASDYIVSGLFFALLILALAVAFVAGFQGAAR